MLNRFTKFKVYWFIGFAIVCTDFLSMVVPAVAQASPTSSNAYAETAKPSPDYILGAGDEVNITVLGYDEYNGARTISPGGTLTLPLIGSVKATGKTTDELAKDLATRLNYFLIQPTVTVTTGTLRPVFVTLAGEVRRPGPIQIQSQTPTGPRSAGLPTLSTAIVAAGGITPRADIRQVQIKRTLPDGEVKTLTVNLWKGILAEATPENPQLQDGDTVFIPQLTADTNIDRRLIAKTSLAPETIRVRVVGEVTRPGEVQVPPNSSLSSAVAIAGGPTQNARLKEVNFIRLNDQGKVERQEIDLRNLTDTHQVQDGDVIIIPRTASSTALDVAGRVLNPLGFLLRFFPF